MNAPAGRRLLTHDCPGCGGPGLSRDRYACRPCWGRLPWELRDRIMTAWRARRNNPTSMPAVLAHEAAKHAAEDWYTSHPASERNP